MELSLFAKNSMSDFRSVCLLGFSMGTQSPAPNICAPRFGYGSTDVKADWSQAENYFIPETGQKRRWRLNNGLPEWPFSFVCKSKVDWCTNRLSRAELGSIVGILESPASHAGQICLQSLRQRYSKEAWKLRPTTRSFWWDQKVDFRVPITNPKPLEEKTPQVTPKEISV